MSETIAEEFIVTEESVRCSGFTENGYRCDRLLTKLLCYISVSPEIRKLMQDQKLTISQVMTGIEVKIGLETKCRGCRKMDYKLKVI